MIYDPIAKRSINPIPTKPVRCALQTKLEFKASINVLAISSQFIDSYFYSFMLSFL